MPNEKRQPIKNNKPPKKAQNGIKHEFSEAHDSKWIIERGGSNPEPPEAPTERPHAKSND